ncbi:MAG: hypothetical protein MZU97_02205 [Bacillus subtilis]|nr:hypothetical protein [Bacillus subtilis]
MLEIYKVLGDVYLDKNDLNNAILTYEKAYNYDHEMLEVLYNRRLLIIKQGMLDKAALFIIKKIVNIEPGNFGSL